MAWTDERKQQAIESYKEGNPTAENSTELVKQIAEELDESPNGVRMILTQAHVYVKKTPATGGSATKTGTTTTAGDKAPRVSKESQLTALREAIEARNVELDEDVISKLTGKAAAYFIKVLSS